MIDEMFSNIENSLQKNDFLENELLSNGTGKVTFSVDANIINRLGRELVGRAETAVSELVKNAYDADANTVTLNFVSSNIKGGSLIISDDGHGMTIEQLIKGFMTLSSTSKIHEPLSPKYQRRRAGRKGIGRFATQFLGEKLTIITNTIEDDKAIKIIIDWNDYEKDRELSTIQNNIELVQKEKAHGTTLYIEQLRHTWTDAQIRRVFRYISDLLQPAYLSKKSENLTIAKQSDDFFLVECLRTENNLTSSVADIDKVLFDKALAEIEGYIDDNFDAYFGVKSTSFDIDDFAIPITASEKGGSNIEKYKLLKNIHFKVYYFVYNRPEYYTNGITKMELSNISELSGTQSGIRMYRNGFRVLPYGEIGDDWLGLDRKRRKIDLDLEEEENIEFNIPYANRNFFGFVEVIDYEGVLFEETASREGLIENDALIELRDFVRKAIVAGIQRISPFVYKEKKKRDEKIKNTKTINEKLIGIQAKLDDITSDNINDSQEEREKKEEAKLELKEAISNIKIDLKNILDELAMLRILATLGITIGEFTHEIIQFPVFFKSKLKALMLKDLEPSIKESIKQVIDKVLHLDTYTNYFNDAVSRNSKRDIEIIELRQVVKPFIDSTKWDFEHEGISISYDFHGYDLFTCPMHPSEWHSILLNLYTNSKKALRRAKPKMKKIDIQCGKINDIVYLEFSDNGDGIAKEYEERIFEPFFTTSTPASINASERDQLVGSGLGLKILKDIITEYKGDIFLTTSSEDYVTTFRIELPAATDEEIDNLEKLKL